jgi:hypothetical protein
MIIRIRYTKRGGHYHCRIFTSAAVDHTFGLCGNLVFDDHEWAAVCDKLHLVCEFIKDEITEKSA